MNRGDVDAEVVIFQGCGGNLREREEVSPDEVVAQVVVVLVEGEGLGEIGEVGLVISYQLSVNYQLLLL